MFLGDASKDLLCLTPSRWCKQKGELRHDIVLYSESLTNYCWQKSVSKTGTESTGYLKRESLILAVVLFFFWSVLPVEQNMFLHGMFLYEMGGLSSGIHSTVFRCPVWEFSMGSSVTFSLKRFAVSVSVKLIRLWLHLPVLMEFLQNFARGHFLLLWNVHHAQYASHTLHLSLSSSSETHNI